MMNKLKSEKLIFLSNKEINYANQVNLLIKNMNQKTKSLISRIELELKK